MSAPTTPPPRLEVVPADVRGPVVENAVLGTVLFCVVEAMLFAGLISAHTIVKSNAIEWPPPGQPRLPVAVRPMAAAIALGAFFVGFQGWEWLGLLREGLTLTSSQHGSFFYLIVGMHAAHAVAAIGALAWAWRRLVDLRLSSGAFGATAVFWYFVVAVWPVLYWRVYL
jgi:heme/copper-type cytochrome/quinol oxidase subunit 3